MIPENQNVGRNRNEQMPYYFRKTCEWIGSETEIHTVTQFRDKMREYVYNDGCGDDVSYTKDIKRLLKDPCKENIIIFSKGPRKDDLISFHDMAAYLIKLKHKDKNDSRNDKIKRTLLTAVDIIKHDIRNMKFNNDFCPTPTEITDLKGGAEWIPASLYTILLALIPSELKSVSVGQSIVQASKSRSVIAPMLFGRGIMLDQFFDHYIIGRSPLFT